MKLRIFRRTAILLSIGTIAPAAIAAYYWPDITQSLRRRDPFCIPYVWYHNLRYPWHSPSEVGNGRMADRIILNDPMGLAQDSSGNIYVSDRERVVWRIERSGRGRIIAGTGRCGVARTGIDARESDLGSPEGVFVDDDNIVYFTDSVNDVILKIDEQGILTKVAGSGLRGFSGDGGPALEASFYYPADVRVDSRGNIYIADVQNNRVRKVDRNGIISTVAGTGEPGYSGDGGPATQAQLFNPYGIAFDLDGSVIISDSWNHVIRRIDASGIITTIAGTGKPGYSGDGGPALQASFDAPQALFVDSAGRLYIGDEHNNCIRMIETDGTISTVLGIGEAGFSPDGTRADEARISDPENIWVSDDGSLLVTDSENGRVRLVSPAGIISTVAGVGKRDKVPARMEQP